ncbi:hypothetical protein BUE93_09120 [Chromobacterium amazonense]|uniref:Protein YebE n=1 Tax=Chromobacterium amazonense TaxID=1382803 RepID=A0A2S9X5H9_9NEIS|nr:tellurite resistance TerB family protein [Chromobacterium amazonense]PRP70974.1 hypothetical protein BUE93_09120 [Chromobacterium amazonense]
MSASKLLDRLLQSGKDLIDQPALGWSSLPNTSKDGRFLTGLGSGALTGGALGLLLSNKKARKMGGKLAVYGGLAALGVVAYRAYSDWQSKQNVSNSPPRTLDRLPPSQIEGHSRAVLVAMIAAAKADGHVSSEERGLLETELVRLSGNEQDRHWLESELASPLEPAKVAALAITPELAAEMYLASALVVDEDTYMERAYLDEFARQLRLPQDLQRQLEQQVQAELSH